MEPRHQYANNFETLKAAESITDPSSSPSTFIAPSMVFMRALERIMPLGSLPENWNSYGSRAPRTDALNGAIYLAYGLFHDALPDPAVFPVPNGNVQLEWSGNNIYLEIEVYSKDRFEVLFEDTNSGAKWEAEITNDFTQLSDALSKLVVRPQRPSLRVVK